MRLDWTLNVLRFFCRQGERSPPGMNPDMMELKQRQGLFPTLWLCQNDVWPGVNLCPEGRAGNHYSLLGRQEGKLRLAFWEDTRSREPAPYLLTCAICNEDSQSPFEEFCCQPAKRETQRERQAGSLAKQSGVQFPEQDHSVFVGTREGACGCKEVEASLETVFSCLPPLAPPIFNVAPFFGSSESERTLCGYYTVGFFLPFSSLDSALRARGETMIKSSWFYVKFKYSDKVSQYIFFSQGKPASPCSLMLTGLVVTLGGEGAQEC